MQHIYMNSTLLVVRPGMAPALPCGAVRVFKADVYLFVITRESV